VQIDDQRGVLAARLEGNAAHSWAKAVVSAARIAVPQLSLLAIT